MITCVGYLYATFICWAVSVFILAWLFNAGVSKETGAQTWLGLVSVEARPTHYQIPAATKGGISHTHTHTIFTSN